MKKKLKYILLISVIVFMSVFGLAIRNDNTIISASYTTEKLGKLQLSADKSITVHENQEIDLLTALKVEVKLPGYSNPESLLKDIEITTNLDITKPGTYYVTFTLNNQELEIYDSVSSKITVQNIAPLLSSSKTEATVVTGSSVDYISLFGVVATEFNSGDLNSQITVTTTANLAEVGTYLVLFTVIDEEGSKDVLEVSLNVKSNKPVISAQNITILEESVVDDTFIIDAANIVAVNADGSTSNNITITYPAGFDSNVPSDEPYIFSATVTEGSNQATTNFEIYVEGVKPEIDYGINKVEMNVGEPEPTLSELINMFHISAHEFELNDTTITYQYLDAGGIDMQKARSYPIRFTATDDDGQTAFTDVVLQLKNKTSNDQDTQPTLSLNLYAEVVEGTDINEQLLFDLFKPVGYDEEDGTILAELVPVSVNSEVPGEYPITFSITDNDGNIVTKTVRLVVVDLLPDLSYEQSTVIMTYGNAMPDLIDAFGIDASEESFGDLNESIEVAPINIIKPGLYNVIFTVHDQENNEDSLTLSLIVLEPENKIPVISGKEHVEINETHTEIDLVELFEVKAVDEEDGELTAIVIELGPHDTDYPGTYNVKFSATDNKGATVYHYGDIEIKDLLPKITTGKTHLTIAKGSTAPDYISEFEIKASEIYENDLIDVLTIDDSQVDFDKTGMYKVTLSASDNDGNTAEGEVFLIIGTTTPITINISSSKYQTALEETSVTKDDLLKIFNINVSASDQYDLTQNIKIVGDYDMSTPGTYELQIVVEYLGVVQNFNIVLEVLDVIPTLSLEKDSITIKDTDKLDNIRELLGVKATEITENDLYETIKADLSEIKEAGGLYVPGVYPVIFTAIDEEGNETSIISTVKVVSTAKPQEFVTDTNEGTADDPSVTTNNSSATTNNSSATTSGIRPLLEIIGSVSQGQVNQSGAEELDDEQQTVQSEETQTNRFVNLSIRNANVGEERFWWIIIIILLLIISYLIYQLRKK